MKRRIGMLAAGMVVVGLLIGCFDEPAKSAAREDAIYDETADARTLVLAALEKAQASDKQVLIQWGGNWCGWCWKLHDFFDENPDVKAILDEHYEVVLVDSKTSDDLQAALSTKVRGVPYLTFLDKDGGKLADQPTGVLETGSYHDPSKVIPVLESWVGKEAPEGAPRVEARAPEQTATRPLPPANTAHGIYDRAVAYAKEQEKTALVLFGTSTCGWCKRFDAYLQRPGMASVLEDNLVVAHINQGTLADGKALREKLAGTPNSGGVPWFAFVDGDGKVLVNALSPKGNVGYPYTGEEMGYFVGLLRSVPQLSASEIAVMERELQAANASYR